MIYKNTILKTKYWDVISPVRILHWYFFLINYLYLSSGNHTKRDIRVKKNCHETLWFADFSFSIAHSILSGCCNCKFLYVQGTYLRTVPEASCVLDSLAPHKQRTPFRRGCTTQRRMLARAGKLCLVAEFEHTFYAQLEYCLRIVFLNSDKDSFIFT